MFLLYLLRSRFKGFTFFTTLTTDIGYSFVALISIYLYLNVWSISFAAILLSTHVNGMEEDSLFSMLARIFLYLAFCMLPFDLN